MRRHLRINYLLIVLLALAVAVGGSVGAYYLSDRLAFSAVWYGSGTEEDPYRLYDDSQILNLQELSSSPAAAQYTAGKYFVLKNNVTLSAAAKETRYGFQGILDGGGHTVTLGKGAMFYRLSGEAVVKNLTVKFNLTAKPSNAEVCALARSVTQKATIENCVAEGVLNIELSTKYNQWLLPVQLYCAPFAVVNHGQIRGCTFRGQIRTEGTSLRTLCMRQYIGGIAASGLGTIDSCEVYADIDVIPDGYVTQISGISPACTATDCRYIGNLTCRMDPSGKYSSMAIARSIVYGLGPSVQNGYFEGDIIQPPIVTDAGFMIAEDGSTYEFRGRFLRASSDGATEEIPHA